VIQDEVCTVALKEQGLFLSIRKSMRWRQNLKSVLEARLCLGFHGKKQVDMRLTGGDTHVV
jgi:hypothetical protein